MYCTYKIVRELNFKSFIIIISIIIIIITIIIASIGIITSFSDITA